MMATFREVVVDRREERLDNFLAGQGFGLSRSQARRLVDEGHVLLNGGIPKPSRVLHPGDHITVVFVPPRPSRLEPQPMALNILHQDDRLLVVDKPAGLTVHPAPGHPSHTLVNGLLALCPDLKGVGGELRPGIVHRLDKDTSGLMVVAKDAEAHMILGKQLHDRTVQKGYLALVEGRVEPAEGIISAPIGRDLRNRKRMAVTPSGREASTRYKVQRYLGPHPVSCSFLDVFPQTGRTHQIRVHFAHLGHPLVGDPVYGKKSPLLDRQFLHAHTLGFRHPGTGQFVEFNSPLPEELRKALEDLDGYPG